MGLGRGYTIRVESLRDLIEVYDREIVMLERDIHRHLAQHTGLSGGAGDQSGRANDRGDLIGWQGSTMRSASLTGGARAVLPRQQTLFPPIAWSDDLLDR
jgi:hypothetical protein